MEDDDEFGDLYTDVLRPFSSSSLSSSVTAPPPPEPSLPSPPNPHRLIDLNVRNGHKNDDGDEILYGASRRNQTLQADKSLVKTAQNLIDNNSAGAPRVLDSSVVELPVKHLNTGDLADKELNFDIEEGNTGIDEDSGPMIPGLGVGTEVLKGNEIDVSGGGEGAGDWEEDSDSEDDLQIVLNDTNHGPMGMERGGMAAGDVDDDDDDDDDGDPLVIVADGDPSQAMEEQDWGVGDDAAAAVAGAEGDRKEGGEVAGKGTASVAPKVGYSSHGYNPFHSQFKYVRPGAAPIPVATTGGSVGAPGQVRPPMNVGPMAGRGRGDWRPLQKGFHQGFGMPGWGNTAGRGFSGGLEFTLPSHKTIFEVDIDGFEEKPWKYPGVDISDFFNFGLNEESWKDYCKQLEQHRLETTMQSKIRVYESGRAEQEYDPDLPPELAAAAGIHDAAADNSNLGKSDLRQSDITKGSARVRPPIPTGRAIQVETGYGERLPSSELRQGRFRDSDAIIEIVLQDSFDDDSSAANDVQDGGNSDPPRDEFRRGNEVEDDMVQMENEYFDDFPQGYDNQKGGRRTPYQGSVRDNVHERDGMLPFHSETPAQCRPGSRGQPPMFSGGDFDAAHEERRTQGRNRDVPSHSTPNRSSRDSRSIDNVEEESVESMGDKCGPESSSPVTAGDVRESSVQDKDDATHDDLVLAEGSPGVEKNEVTETEVTANDSLQDGNTQHFMKKQKITSHLEQSVLQELDDGEDSKAARSSENSKARSGSSKDFQKWQDGIEEEVVQGRSRTGSRRHLDESELNLQRKDHDGRQERERNEMVRKARADSYTRRDLDPSLTHHPHMKNEVYDRRKERENPDGAWQRRDEDPHGRKSRTEDTRKREHGDELGPRHRTRLRESERSDRDEQLHPRKQLDNGSYRAHYDKDSSSRHREREDSTKSRYEIVDDYHSKRRKDEEYLRRDHADKEEILQGHRDSNSRRRRERDDVLDPRKRDDHQRIRESLDDYHSVTHKDEVWLHRERGERQREREDMHRLKQSHEENLRKREREEGRVSMRNGRGTDDNARIGHARVKDEHKSSDKDYQVKDAVRNGEQHKRRDRFDDEISQHKGREEVYARGSQFSSEERRSRQERSSSRIDRAIDTSDNQKVHEKKYKENMRKIKEPDSGNHSTSGFSRKKQEDPSSHANEMGLKGSNEQGNVENDIAVPQNSSKRHKEDASSDDEQQDSRRGRSKLERWTSHKERDFSMSGKSSASLKLKGIDNNNSDGTSEVGKLADEPPKRVEAVEKHPSGEEKDTVMEKKDTDAKPLEDRHLDTVEKLKKRSERFKLPMPIEKDTSAIKKMENEPLPSAKTETQTDLEIKPERPPRKRRWVGN